MNKSDKGASPFNFFGRKKFEALVKKWGVDKGVRGFSTWELTNALISCFVLRLGSYRDVEATLGIADSTFGDVLRLRNSG